MNQNGDNKWELLQLYEAMISGSNLIFEALEKGDI